MMISKSESSMTADAFNLNRDRIVFFISWSCWPAPEPHCHQRELAVDLIIPDHNDGMSSFKCLHSLAGSLELRCQAHKYPYIAEHL